MCHYCSPLITADNIADVLSAVAWPLVVIGMAVAFGGRLRRLLASITELKKGDTTVKFGKAEVDNKKESNPRTVDTRTAPDTAPWNAYNSFWLGHDMMWIIDVLLRAAPAERINHGFASALAHIRALPETDPTLREKLERLANEAKNKVESEWTAELRKRFADDVGGLLQEVGNYTQRFIQS